MKKMKKTIFALVAMSLFLFASSALAVPVIITTPSATATEDILYSYDANETNVDGPSSTWTIVSSNDTCDTLVGASIDAGTGVYTFMPAGPVPPASCVLAIQVCDALSACATHTATTISITAVNDAPTISTTPPEATEDVPYSYNADLTDPDGTGQTWSKLADDNCPGSAINTATGVYTFTTTGPVPPLPCNMSIQVCDNGGLCATQGPTAITSTAVNDAPTVGFSACPTPTTPNFPSPLGATTGFDCIITFTDPDGTSPSTCDVSGADTCGGTLNAACNLYSSDLNAGACTVGVSVFDSGTPAPDKEGLASQKVNLKAPDFSLDFGNQRIFVTIDTLNISSINKYYVFYSKHKIDLEYQPYDNATQEVVIGFQPGGHPEIAIENVVNKTEYYFRVCAEDPSYMPSRIRSIIAQHTTGYTDEDGGGGCSASKNISGTEFRQAVSLTLLWLICAVIIRSNIFHTRRIK